MRVLLSCEFFRPGVLATVFLSVLCVLRIAVAETAQREDETAISSDRLALGEPAEYMAVGEKGPILILLPCWNCRWKEFEPFMKRNAQKYRMHAITFPGQGGANAPTLPLFTGELIWQENAVESVLSVLDSSDGKAVTLVASSWGVKIAIEIAARFPERVKGIINLDGQAVYSKSAMSLTGDPAEFEQGSVSVAHNVHAQYLIPTLGADLDAWQNMNWVSLDDATQRMLVHGWFMSTPRELMFNVWFENIVDTPTHNRRFSELKTRFLDVRTLRPHWTDEQKAKRRSRYSEMFSKEGVNLPEYYTRTWIDDSQHLIPLSNLDALEKIIDDFLSGGEIKELY